jgi:hypothetical protein
MQQITLGLAGLLTGEILYLINTQKKIR